MGLLSVTHNLSMIPWGSWHPSKARWQMWCADVELLPALSVLRRLTPNGFGKVVSRQIHVFSNASTSGYESVAYLRSIYKDGHTHAAILMGKARLALLWRITCQGLSWQLRPFLSGSNVFCIKKWNTRLTYSSTILHYFEKWEETLSFASGPLAERSQFCKRSRVTNTF